MESSGSGRGCWEEMINAHVMLNELCPNVDEREERSEHTPVRCTYTGFQDRKRHPIRRKAAELDVRTQQR
jgi:hypothetical protein